MTTVQNIYDYLDKIAPFASQPKDDNSGLLVGDFASRVNKVLVCLDVTAEVVWEAAEKQVDLIIAHHPLMYRPVSRIMSDEPLYLLIQNGIHLIAAHENLDRANDGISDIMLELMGFAKSQVSPTTLEPEYPHGAGLGRVVELDKAITAKELARKAKTAFGCTVVRYVDGGKPISKIAVCSGGGGFLAQTALDMGCDAYICGDIKWFNFVAASNCGFTLIDAGHFHTENIYCDALVGKLQSRFPEVSVEKAENSVDLCDYVV